MWKWKLGEQCAARVSPRSAFKLKKTGKLVGRGPEGFTVSWSGARGHLNHYASTWSQSTVPKINAAPPSTGANWSIRPQVFACVCVCVPLRNHFPCNMSLDFFLNEDAFRHKMNIGYSPCLTREQSRRSEVNDEALTHKQFFKSPVWAKTHTFVTLFNLCLPPSK